jgi:hypothetical protein
MGNVRVDSKLLTDSAAFIQKTSEAFKKLAARQEGIEKSASDVVDVMIDKGLVESTEKEAAIEALQDHSRALESLKRVSQRVAEIPAMGNTEKTASGYDDPRAALPESERRFLDNLGL